MLPDLWILYRHMLRSRLFEEAVTALWNEGLISGEMHTGVGEEAIAAGVVDHLCDGDAMALDHRGTPPMLMRGVDPILLLKELLGRSDGLCRGMGGHMHLFSPEHLAASSGIVGASGPAAAGFALAARFLRPGSVSVAFFGEGAMNQGMLLEAMNLAVAWNLPVLFVCKDNDWSITTRSSLVTGGQLIDRARSFGMPGVEVDGTDVESLWTEAGRAITRARNSEGPSFLLARCEHADGHFLGDPLVRAVKSPAKEMSRMAGPLLRSLVSMRGASLGERVESFKTIMQLITRTAREYYFKGMDPLARVQEKLSPESGRLKQLEDEVEVEIRSVMEKAVGGAS